MHLIHQHLKSTVKPDILTNPSFQAIKVLENIELNKKSLYSRVPGCQITMYYYVGFAYMMMRRYADAVRTFSNILLYIQRTRGLFQVRIDYDHLINSLLHLVLKVAFNEQSDCDCHIILHFSPFLIHSRPIFSLCYRPRRTRMTRSTSKPIRCTPCWPFAWSSTRSALTNLSTRC
jgi:hypothetical protein